MSGKPSAGGRDTPQIVVGVILFVLAGVLWMDAVRLSGAVAYGVGPAAMPKIVAIGLVILGALSILSGVRSAAPDLEQVNWRAVAMIVGGFLALTLLIRLGAGFIPAMVVLFMATAAAFGRRALHVDAALAFVIALLTYLLFNKLLTLSLPQGPIERLIG